MRRWGVIVADPPWSFRDKLAMSDVRRGAAAQYATMSLDDLCDLPLRSLAEDAAILALWCPASMLHREGRHLCEAWGFEPKTLFTWVKTTRSGGLAFGMGRQFRGCSEHAIIATRGRPAPRPASRSERGVLLSPALPHSAKPEGLQEALERMYPAATKLEMFARRVRPGWETVGLECPSTMGVDIRDWCAGELASSLVEELGPRCPGCDEFNRCKCF